MNIHTLLHDPAADLLNLDLGSEGGGGVPAYCWPGCCWEMQGDEA